MIRITLIIFHLLYFISISKLKKVLYLTLFLHFSFSSIVVQPPWIDCTNFAQDLKGGWYFSIQISCLHSRKKILLLQTTIQLFFFNNCLRSIEFWSDSFIYLMKKDSFVILLEFIKVYLVSCCDLTKKTKMNLQNTN